ncbi:hypothetical protein [Fructobacillus fructosus]|uniref:hypothetical protein n=1 Tax=Fructobacillus fructosus TaxID=1631 RepID=UPI0030C86534
MTTFLKKFLPQAFGAGLVYSIGTFFIGFKGSLFGGFLCVLVFSFFESWPKKTKKLSE